MLFKVGWNEGEIGAWAVEYLIYRAIEGHFDPVIPARVLIVGNPGDFLLGSVLSNGLLIFVRILFW